MQIKHCTFCKNRHSIGCPNSIECYETDTKLYFNNENLAIKIPLLDKFRLLFKKKHYSVDYDTHYCSIIEYKILNGTIYILNERIEKVSKND